MTWHYWLDVGGFVVQLLVICRIGFLCVRKRTIIRLASLEADRNLAEAMFDFHLLRSRDFGDAVLDMDGAEGTMIVHCPEGQVSMENVGYGACCQYSLRTLTPTNLESTVARPKVTRWLCERARTCQPPITRNILQGNEWLCVLTYESLSGRRYRTNLTVNNLVLTSFKFGLD